MAKFVTGINGFDNLATGVLQSQGFWIQKDSVAGPEIASSGVFGGNRLSFTNNGVANAVKLERLVPPAMQLQRSNANPGGTGIFSISFWFEPGTDATAMVPIVAVGDGTNAYNLLGYANVGNGVLYFPSNFNNLADNPITFAMQDSTPVWLTLTFAYWPSARIVASYTINTYFRKSDFQLNWTSDALTGGGYVDRFKFYQGSYDYSIDDLVIQTVVSNNPNWPVASGNNPAPGDIGILTPRRIYTGAATGNGAVDEWEPSSGANYQAATSTDDYVLTDNTTVARDLYQWAVDSGATGINALQLSGKATVPSLVQAIASNNGTIGAIRNLDTQKAPQAFEAVAETDGTNPWTAASINAAQFGVKG